MVKAVNYQTTLYFFFFCVLCYFYLFYFIVKHFPTNNINRIPNIFFHIYIHNYVIFTLKMDRYPNILSLLFPFLLIISLFLFFFKFFLQFFSLLSLVSKVSQWFKNNFSYIQTKPFFFSISIKTISKTLQIRDEDWGVVH